MDSFLQNCTGPSGWPAPRHQQHRGVGGKGAFDAHRTEGSPGLPSIVTVPENSAGRRRMADAGPIRVMGG